MRRSRALLTVLSCLLFAAALAQAAPSDRTLGESRARKTLAYPIDAGRWRIVAHVETSLIFEHERSPALPDLLPAQRPPQA